MKLKNLARCVILGWLPLLLIISLWQVTAAPVDYWPGQTWRVSTPEAQGMDSEKLAEMLDYIQSNKLNVHSVIVIRNGYVVLEAYAEPFTDDVIHIINSCTKSVTSALVGIALDKGYLKNLNQKVVDIFADRKINNLTDAKRLITIEHLLTMSSGIDIVDYGEKQEAYLKSSDWTQYYLDLPVIKQPGTVFNYDSEGVNLLIPIIERSSGMKISDFAEEFLFKPIGITDYYWQKDPQGINTGGWGLALTPMEMARFGYLYLKKGNWNGEQIIPKDWVEASMTNHIDSSASYLAISKDKGYGYLWWGLPFGGFTGHGYGGQFIMVMPEKELVVVFTSGFSVYDWRTPLELTESFILKSIVTDKNLARNLEKEARLAAAIRELGNPSNPEKSVIPEIAKKISGKKFVLEANSWNMKSVTVHFNGEDECIFKVEQQGMPMMKLVAGLDGKYRKNRLDLQFPHLSRGRWISENAFLLELYSPWINSSKCEYLCRLDGGQLKLTAKSTVGEWVQDFIGKMEK